VTAATAARERAIADLASRQRGLVTRTQLLQAGLTRAAVDNRVKSGRLQPLYRGVYLLGHAHLSDGARELGAVLACGPNAFVSHRSAAGLWHLYPAQSTEVDITVVGRNPGSKRGIRVHRAPALGRSEIRRLGGIPLTSPARTILDLAGSVASRELERAYAEAETRRLVRRNELLALLARYPHRPGAAGLRSLIEGDARPALTRSEAEERLLALIRSAELPAPELNARVAGIEVDFLWRDRRLVVEVDGFAFHSHRAAFERDRERDAALAALGYRIVRVTWRQIVHRPATVLARIAAALALA
jgi:very-short-patch-repair endonuclease